jgi:coenzyme F420-reducing hydrogenase gamma subunit
MAAARKPRLAVIKFASCDGCQLSILDCEDELLAVAGAVDIANFPEASRAVLKGPYDLTLVEGSITTPHDAERIHAVRRVSKVLVSIGACATAGGIQALRNFAEVGSWVPLVYATPDWIHTLKTSTPISHHVKVDYELQGCPFLPSHAVCMDCKRRGVVCVTVARGEACLGPVTRTGCGALCPSYGRGCYGCFGPLRGSANTDSLSAVLEGHGYTHEELTRLFRTFTSGAEAFRKASEHHEHDASESHE